MAARTWYHIWKCAQLFIPSKHLTARGKVFLGWSTSVPPKGGEAATITCIYVKSYLVALLLGFLYFGFWLCTVYSQNGNIGNLFDPAPVPSPRAGRSIYSCHYVYRETAKRQCRYWTTHGARYPCPIPFSAVRQTTLFRISKHSNMRKDTSSYIARAHSKSSSSRPFSS
jgi:hypothetical protein